MTKRLAALGMFWLVALAAPASAGHGRSEPVPAVSPEEVRQRLDGRNQPVLVDLRPREEFQKAHLPGARSVPLPELRRRHREVPRTGRVVLYCACGPMEVQAAYQFLRDLGYRDVSVLEEGFAGWAKRGYPLEH
jgi:rhodanese-related sulfurtransferase